MYEQASAPSCLSISRPRWEGTNVVHKRKPGDLNEGMTTDLQHCFALHVQRRRQSIFLDLSSPELLIVPAIASHSQKVTCSALVSAHCLIDTTVKLKKLKQRSSARATAEIEKRENAASA